jgi:hypothetical protein
LALGFFGKMLGRNDRMLGGILLGAHNALIKLLEGVAGERGKAEINPRSFAAFLGALPFAAVVTALKKDPSNKPFERYLDTLVTRYTKGFLSRQKAKFPKKEDILSEQGHFRNAVLAIRDEFVDLIIKDAANANQETSSFKKPTERAHFYLYGTEEFDTVLSTTIADYIDRVHDLIQEKRL